MMELKSEGYGWLHDVFANLLHRPMRATVFPHLKIGVVTRRYFQTELLDRGLKPKGLLLAK
jgi:hypothetical protein